MVRGLLKFATAIDGAARVARGIDWSGLLQPGAGQKPFADSANNAINHYLDLGTTSKIEYGFVVDAIPSARCYRVQPESGGGTIDCCLSMRGTVSPLGVYDGGTLIPGTHVKFVRHKQAMSGIILGTVPMYMWNPQLFYGDVISQGSNTGVKKETGYNTVIQLPNAVTNWSGRTPYDSLEIGEYNRSTETGLMIHMDSYMAFMRASEVTGLWMFYWDNLLRIAGRNFEEWAGMSERSVYDDEGEVQGYHGIATYPWEHRGWLKHPDSSYVHEYSAYETQENFPYYARLEPLYDDMQPFHRWQQYTGYLGQGSKQIMSAPNLTEQSHYTPGYLETGSTSNDEVFRFSDSSYEIIGLQEQQTTLSGHYFVRTALGMSFAKRPIIPVPHRVEMPASDHGDLPDNYRASSYYGSTSESVDPHKVQPTPDPAYSVVAQEKSLHGITAILDLHAHLFNWEGMHPFYYHKKDFKVPEESEYTAVENNQDVPSFLDKLDSNETWYLPQAETETITLDHRTGGTAKVFKNTSYISLLDDGGIAIGDGWGAEIRMVAGSIFLSCPGDVFMEPGRNVIAFGGRDICLRAWNCVDISTTKKDVRIKAEQNLHMLAANDKGKHGMFFECRSNGPESYNFTKVGEDIEATGIVFLAPATELVGMAHNIYLRTVDDDQTGKNDGTSEAPATTKDGDIVLDARKGKGDICTRSRFIKHWVHCAIMHSFQDQPSAELVNFFTLDGCILGGDVYTDGDLVSFGSHVIGQDFLTSKGHFYSKTGGLVLRLKAEAAASAQAAIMTGYDYEEELWAWSDSEYQIDMYQNWYQSGRPGDTDTIKSFWFSMRTTDNYKSKGFVLYETRWAQMARFKGQSIPIWEEKAVETNKASSSSEKSPSYPFPGKKRLTMDGDVYKQQPLKLVDTDNNWAKDRGEDYEATVSLLAPDVKMLNNYYPHIGKTDVTS